MGYPWDWFKSAVPWVTHGTGLSLLYHGLHMHGTELSYSNSPKLPLNNILDAVTILGPFLSLLPVD